MPVNLECLAVVAEKFRAAEAPYKEAGNPRGLGIGAMAVVVEDAGAELARMREAMTEIADMPFSMVNDADSLRHTIRTMQAIARQFINSEAK